MKAPIAPPDNDWSLLDNEQLQELAKRIETTVDFDDGRGDTTLIVRKAGEEHLENDVKNFSAFKVSSAAMIRASPFWEKVFLGPFSEAQPGHMKVLNYIEDDTVNLEILLDIIHLRFNRIPPYVSLKSLAEMAALTDKFCATRIVGPWIWRWLDQLDQHGSEPQWIWISWEYGLEDIYDLPGTLPPTIEDKAIESRRTIVKDTLCGIYKYFNKLRRLAKGFDGERADYVGSVAKKYCDEGRRECVLTQIGAYFCGLENRGLWPEKDPSEILMSPDDLREILQSIFTMVNHPTIPRNVRYSHSCGRFKSIIDGLSESSPLLSMSGEQRARLAKQHGLWAFPNDHIQVEKQPRESSPPHKIRRYRRMG
ncbi:hypothetical protein SLS62_008423 [Diatrype stigma]|uniref:BTB domain-containing protein n=1 Tax=Diatrype stigma TaxID=117547 RepID=A0AAN9YLZ0_9PEZI